MLDSETDRLPMRPGFVAELAEMDLVSLPHGRALQADTLVHVDRVTAGRYGSLERAGGTVWTLAAVGAEDFTFKVKVKPGREKYTVDRHMCGIQESAIANYVAVE